VYRGTENEEAVNLRLQNAEAEMKRAKMGNLYEKFLMNGQVDETFKRLLSAIYDIYELDLNL
jgi:guanylate kinase